MDGSIMARYLQQSWGNLKNCQKHPSNCSESGPGIWYCQQVFPLSFLWRQRCYINHLKLSPKRSNICSLSSSTTVPPSSTMMRCALPVCSLHVDGKMVMTMLMISHLQQYVCDVSSFEAWQQFSIDGQQPWCHIVPH